MTAFDGSGLTAYGLTKSYGDHTLWKGLRVEAHLGELTAISGRSGSGKSTLLNCLGLLDSPDAGRIELNGKQLQPCSRRQARLFRKNTVGYLFQNYALIETATVRQNLAVVTEWTRDIKDVLSDCGLAGRENEKVFHLSGGEQQRVATARLLLKSPPLVLADEPTGALDHDNATAVVGLLRQLADAGSCVVIATHSEAVMAACDRLINLDELT